MSTDSLPRREILFACGIIINAVLIVALVLQGLAVREMKRTLVRERQLFTRECFTRSAYEDAQEAFALELQLRNPQMIVPLRVHKAPEKK